MRLLQINTVVNSGSTGRIAEDVGKLFLENSHESYIAYGRGDRPSQSQLIKIGGQYDIYNHGVQTLLFDRHGLSSKSATKKLITEIEAIDPDVIGLHNLHGYYLNYPLLFQYLKSSKKPVVWTFHDCWPFTGHCAYFDSVNCQKWQSHCQKCPLSCSYPKSYTDRSYKNFDDKRESFLGVEQLTVITPSKWLKLQVNQSFLKDYPVEVIHNGIDLELFKVLPELERQEFKIILGVASTWDQRKGLDDFITLSSMLPDNYRIVLIGLNDQQIERLPKNIKGIKRTESIEALAEWYNKADVFVNPTYVDNFPTTNIEALACGTPVITYDTGGSPEAIDDETGAVVNKGDVSGLLHAIQKMVKDDETIRNCRARAEQLFDKNDRYKDYLRLYEAMLIK